VAVRVREAAAHPEEVPVAALVEQTGLQAQQIDVERLRAFQVLHSNRDLVHT